MPSFHPILKISAFFTLLFNLTYGSRMLQDSDSQPLRYHNGPLLHGTITVNLIWYGKFTPAQRAIVVDFISSLSSSPSIPAQPSVATWWKSVDNYYRLASPRYPSSPSLHLGRQILDPSCSLGKSLSDDQIVQLASRGDHSNAINVVLTAADVSVAGFCVNRCGTHGSRNGVVKGKRTKFAYIWAGNSEAQCPGYCAWPFYQPIYGPQGPPLVAPNNDLGLDGIVMNLGRLLVGTATNPFGNGFYQGPAGAQLEAATSCTGVYGKGAYPGYAGELLVDPNSGASYNAHGALRAQVPASRHF